MDEGGLVWVGGSGVFIIAGVEEGHEVTFLIENPGGGAHEGEEEEDEAHLGT